MHYRVDRSVPAVGLWQEQFDPVNATLKSVEAMERRAGRSCNKAMRPAGPRECKYLLMPRHRRTDHAQD